MASDDREEETREESVKGVKKGNTPGWTQYNNSVKVEAANRLHAPSPHPPKNSIKS